MTQRVYLIRHAAALPRHEERWPDDSERPLSREGMRYFEKVAAGVSRGLPAPLTVLCSPWLRAWQTADLLSAAGWPSPQVLAALAPGGDPAEVLSALPTERRIALVGHAPDLALLASLILVGDPGLLSIEMKKGGMLALDYDRALGIAQLKWHAGPELLRRIA